MGGGLVSGPTVERRGTWTKSRAYSVYRIRGTRRPKPRCMVGVRCRRAGNGPIVIVNNRFRAGIKKKFDRLSRAVFLNTKNNNNRGGRRVRTFLSLFFLFFFYSIFPKTGRVVVVIVVVAGTRVKNTLQKNKNVTYVRNKNARARRTGECAALYRAAVAS